MVAELLGALVVRLAQWLLPGQDIGKPPKLTADADVHCRPLPLASHSLPAVYLCILPGHRFSAAGLSPASGRRRRQQRSGAPGARLSGVEWVLRDWWYSRGFRFRAAPRVVTWTRWPPIWVPLSVPVRLGMPGAAVRSKGPGRPIQAMAAHRCARPFLAGGPGRRSVRVRTPFPGRPNGPAGRPAAGLLNRA